MRQLFLALILFFFSSCLAAQIYTEFRNPSFEGTPRASTVPPGWVNCGKPGETPPDIQPAENPAQGFGVTTLAVHGDTYIGMVVRDNETWEGIGQKLSKPLEAGQNYWMTAKLARSNMYVSQSRKTGNTANYTEPVKLRIWTGDGFYDKRELLIDTDLIEHTSWELYEFKLQPSENANFLIFEVFYKTPSLFAYNGNLLMDDLSPIYKSPPPQEDWVAYRLIEPLAGEDSTLQAVKVIDLDKEFFKMVDQPRLFGPSHPILLQAFLLYKLDHDQKLNIGLRHFINELKLEEQRLLNEAIQQMHLKEVKHIFNKVLQISLKHKKGEELSKEEYNYLNGVDPIFAYHFAHEDFETEHLRFLKKHHAELDEEYYDFQTQSEVNEH